MNKIVIVATFFLLGCSGLQNIAEKAPMVKDIGETAIEIGATTNMFNPVIGVWIVAVGGLVVAASELLKLSKPKKRKEK